jgi:hypothetical protein
MGRRKNEMRQEILSQINSLGNELVKCPLNCVGIDNVKQDGKIPRCINLELENRNSDGKGVIIAGMNPGKAKKEEMKIYISDNGSYDSHKYFMNQYILKEGKNKYHDEIREIVTLLGFDGPILWSEIVKCQSKEGINKLDVQTIRNCVHRFLKKEIELFKEFPIIAIGNESFRTCSLLFPDRQIIGIEHPSGTNRNYSKFKRKLVENIKSIKVKINNLRENEAIHLNKIYNKNV